MKNVKEIRGEGRWEKNESGDDENNNENKHACTQTAASSSQQLRWLRTLKKKGKKVLLQKE